jgi:hypothetical protein
MTRLWISGKPVDVTTSNQLPHTFIWDDQSHRVEIVVERWRVDMEWWRWRIWRDYFTVATDTGLLVVLFNDLLLDSWYVQRLYD